MSKERQQLSADELVLPVKRTDGDTLEERLTANAYHNILPARYLRKDADGNVTENPEELFARVAKNIALAEAVFEADKQDVEITVTPAQLKPDHPRRDELAAEVFGAGTTVEDDAETTLTEDNVNKFAYDTIVPDLPESVRETVVAQREEFQELMERLSFMPNSPTLMNAGDELQQLSACFVDSPADDITDIHQTAKEAAEIFQCLTDDARVHVEGKGVVSVADVAPGDAVRQRDPDGGHRFRNVDEVHAYDDSPVLRVETEAGVTLTGTPNHRLLANGEWTRLDELAAGDGLSVRLGWLPDTDETVELTPVAAGAQWERTRGVSNDAILELYAEGLSDYEIADRLDCSASTVQRRRANELGLDPNGSGGRDPGSVAFDTDEFRRLYEDGHTDAEMASKLDVSAGTVTQYRSRSGLEPNGQPVKTVSQPTTLSEDLAELVGLWVGDGSKHDDGIRFHLRREETLEHADHLCRRLFDEGLDWRWDEGCYDAVLHSHEIKRWWLANFGDAKHESSAARVPDTVWQADHATVAAFCRGLFTADGSVQNDTHPRLWSASDELVDEVQQLLIGIGIPAAQWELDSDERDYFTVGPTSAAGLRRFADRVGFLDSRDDDLAAAVAATDLQDTTFGTVDADTGIWTLPVTSVDDAGTDTVYDLTVADTHEYVADGVVSHNSGGGMGYAFWKLRPYGDPVGSTGGIASGPITFMRTYDQLCETIAQGGARRGAQMGVMRVSHPDVIQFIHAKNKDVSLAHSLRLNDPDDFTHTSFAEALEEARDLIDDDGKVPRHLRNAVEGHLSNFNISVGVTHDFMEALYNDEEFTFTNPRTGDPHVATPQTKELYEMFGLGEHVEVGEVLSIPAQALWDDIVEGAHENGEPGVIYLDRVNDEHSFDIEEHPDHEILATNPCGEQPLEEYEACNLGHINLSTLAADDAPDWRVWYDAHREAYDDVAAAMDAFIEEAIDLEEFDRRIESGTRFLENVVTMSDFPVPEIEEKVRRMRKIGMGVMGLAQLYIQLGIQYGTEPGNELARQLMVHINHGSKRASHDLAEERGSFADWDDSKYADPTRYADWFEHHTGEAAADWADGYAIRNHNTTTIAPTGCVAEDSLVSTDEGLREIGTLDGTTAEFEQWDDLDIGVATDGGTKQATAVYDNGFDAVKQLRTAGGFSVTSTFGHRFRTITEDGSYEWKEARAFEPGDKIVLQRGTFEDGARPSLDTSERDNYHWNTSENLTLPEEMTPELAEFLGYYMGDGYVHEDVGVKIVVESAANDLDDHLRKLGKSVFGVEPTVEDKETRHILSFGGRHLPRYFENNGWTKDDGNDGAGAASAFVPEAILGADEACAKAFLRGLFEADGCASRKVELSTVSETLAEQVQTLLLALGCVFVRDELPMDDREDHFGDRLRYSLRGANRREDIRFVEQVGFITKSVAPELSAQSYKNDTYPPALIERLRELDGYSDVSSDVKHRVNQSPTNGSLSRKTVRDVERQTGKTVTLDGRPLTQFYVATIDSVEDGRAYTKDISVPSNNTYVANGFVTHNTTSMIGNTTGGCEPIYNVAYYKNVSDDVQGDEMLVEFDDYFLRTLEANDIDVEAVKQEAQEQMAANEFDGVASLSTVPDAISELFVVTSDLSGKQHAAVQCASQEGVDSAISKCIEEGTIVQTDQGLVPIEAFSDNDEPGTFSDVDGEYTIDGHRVTAHYYAGEKESTRIRLDSGAELVGATESHRVMTSDGWQLLSELEEGDVVLGDFVESHGDGSLPIEWGDDLRTSANDVRVPDRMSPAFAEFLGMIAADGGAYEETGRVEITTDKMPVEDRFAALCEELFDEQVRVEYDDRTENVRRVYVTSRNLARCIRRLIGEGAYGKHVPEQVIRGDADEKLAFVRGLTLDGYDASNGFTVYGGMSEDLAYQTAQLLRSFGLPKVYEGRKWVSESEAYAHHVTVSNELQDLVTAIEEHKNPEPNFVRYKVPVDPDDLSLDNFETGTSEYYAARSARNRGNPYLFNETADKIGVEYAGVAYEVTEVESVGTRELYDIEVEDSHQYVVNGMVSHNTCNFPNSATIEDMDEVYRYIYDHGGKGVTVYRDGTRSKQVLTTRAQNTEFADMDPDEAAEAIVEQIEEVFGGFEAFLEHEDVRELLNGELEGFGESTVEYADKQPRPDVLRGVTQRIDTGYGKLYVTINEDPEREQPFELFANIGNSGGFTASFTEALAKTISTALRSGVDPEELANELQGIRSPKVAWDKGEQINSIPDAVGTAIRRYLDDEIDKPYPRQQRLEEAAQSQETDPDGPNVDVDTDTGTDASSEPPKSDGGATVDSGGATADAGPSADRGPGSAETEDATQDLIDAGESPECPECGAMSLYYSEGCKTCQDCGWSEC